MSFDPHSAVPFNETSAAALAAQGLQARVIPAADRDLLRPWAAAVARGFLGGESEPEEAEAAFDTARPRRIVGVYDPGAPDARVPVATVDSWVGELTLPGGDVLPAWAISGVTVAATHSRRGIARALLEDQLRTAAGAGIAMAMLTASESQLYGRYGFAPGAFAADLEIDARRAKWIGPEPAGRVDFVTVPEWVERIVPLFDRARRTRPGDVDVWPALWPRWAGLIAEKGAEAKKRRAVQYRDEVGEVHGLLIYKTTGGEEDYTQHTLEVLRLDADTEDAYAALWRYALRHPLVRSVRAELRSIDEPVRWMIDDMRAIQQRMSEHQYLRVLDADGVLAARGVQWAGSFSDPLGIAGPADAAGPSVRDLAAAYLGAPGTRRLPAALASRLASPQTPYLSTWY